MYQQFVKGGTIGAPPVQKATTSASPRIPFGKPPPLDFAGQPLPKGIVLAPADPVTPVTPGTGTTTKTSYKYSFATALEYVNTHVIGTIQRSISLTIHSLIYLTLSHTHNTLTHTLTHSHTLI